MRVLVCCTYACVRLRVWRFLLREGEGVIHYGRVGSSAGTAEMAAILLSPATGVRGGEAKYPLNSCTCYVLHRAMPFDSEEIILTASSMRIFLFLLTPLPFPPHFSCALGSIIVEVLGFIRSIK